ncbi:hypothetical protein RDV78_04895 [Bacillota bacterium LX-D]|nr:hypothetical protein [Bacillota bacterium LX-D]
MDDKYLKYGGIKFKNNVPPKEINEFVARLPEEKRGSLYQVAKELTDHGLITLEGEFSTIDDDLQPYLES